MPDMNPGKKEIIAAINAHFLIVDCNTGFEWILEQLFETGEEFCYSFHFTKRILDRYSYNGFLPMSVQIADTPLLALKLHEERVLLDPKNCTIKKKAIKKFTDHYISIDRNFAECVHSINAYHTDSWLSGPLVKLFLKFHANESGRLKLHSVELWKDKQLVAGELGYSIGSCYTSLTGFHTVDSSGKAQLYALGQLLRRNGFKIWDMGMYAPYKIEAGGNLYPRETFLKMLFSVRKDSVCLNNEKVLLSDL